MIFGFLTAFIFIGLIIGAAVFAYKRYENIEHISSYDNDNERNAKQARNKVIKKQAVASIVLAVICVLCFFLVPFSFHTVDQSEVAVVKQLGKIKDVKGAGTTFGLWITNSYKKYSTKVQEVNLDDIAYSSDAQQMTLNIKFQYQIMPDKVIEIATNYGSLETLEARLTPTVRDKVKGVMSSMTAMSIIENRETLSGAAFEAVKEALGTGYYISVTSVAITNIDFSDQFETAVEEKMIAEQNALKAEYENDAKVAKAKADAEAKLVTAQAEADANKLLENSVTDKILEKLWLDKWDGKLPEVVAGDDMSMILPSKSAE